MDIFWGGGGWGGECYERKPPHLITVKVQYTFYTVVSLKVYGSLFCAAVLHAFRWILMLLHVIVIYWVINYCIVLVWSLYFLFHFQEIVSHMMSLYYA